MSRIKGIILLTTLTLAMFVAPNMDALTNTNPPAANTTDLQASTPDVDWCCLAGLACCVQKSNAK